MKNTIGHTMHLVYALVMGLILATNVGCAAQAQATRADVVGSRRPVPPPAAQLPPVGPAVAVAPPPAAGVVPPGRPVPAGPPQNFAWLHTPPQGCESGPLSLQVTNQTRYYLTVLIDGQALRVRGSQGELPHLPPGERAYVCLNELGTHSVTGVAYVGRYGQLTELLRFGTRHVFTIDSTNAFGRQQVEVTNGYVSWHRVRS